MATFFNEFINYVDKKYGVLGDILLFFSAIFSVLGYIFLVLAISTLIFPTVSTAGLVTSVFGLHMLLAFLWTIYQLIKFVFKNKGRDDE